MTTKISALPAATAAAETDQFEINQGGTSKRVTTAQILARRGLLAQAHNSAAITYTTGGSAIIDFDTVDYDPLSLITTGASWHLTIPATGWYMVCVRNGFVDPNGSAYTTGQGVEIDLRVNGSFADTLAYEDCDGTGAGTNHWMFLNGARAYNLTAADTVALKFDSSFAGATRKLGDFTGFELYRVA